MNAKLTAADLAKIVESSFDRKFRDEQIKKERHEQFLVRMKDTSFDFMNVLEDEIQGFLLDMANRGRKSVRFQSFLQFGQKFGNCKVSTLVYGWRSKDGWDKEKFKELGFDGTPFDMLVKDFGERGISVKNISNPNKGFGFWIEASIMEENPQQE